MSTLSSDITDFITSCHDSDLYRKRKIKNTDQDKVSFSSNDYLGFAAHPEVAARASEALHKYGTGSSGSALVNGYTELHHETELAYAKFLGYPKALLFSSGYMANLAIIGSLMNKGDAILHDKLNHASLLDASKLTKATSERYLHQDIDNLASRLAKYKNAKKKLVVSNGVFSMKGTFANTKGIIKTAKKHNAMTLIDDAHGLGVIGKNGKGTLEYTQVNPVDVTLLACSLGKSMGSAGAIVAMSDTLADYFVQCARSYIYTSILPPASAAAALTSLRLLVNEPIHLKKLQSNIVFFNEQIKKTQLPITKSITAIQNLTVGTAKKAMELTTKLDENGFVAPAIRPPSVPHGQSCIRITLSAKHTHEQIADFIKALIHCYDNIA